jgi:hypothetical protein
MMSAYICKSPVFGAKTMLQNRSSAIDLYQRAYSAQFELGSGSNTLAYHPRNVCSAPKAAAETRVSLWVKSLLCKKRCPLYPRKRTCAAQ